MTKSSRISIQPSITSKRGDIGDTTRFAIPMQELGTLTELMMHELLDGVEQAVSQVDIRALKLLQIRFNQSIQTELGAPARLSLGNWLTSIIRRTEQIDSSDVARLEDIKRILNDLLIWLLEMTTQSVSDPDLLRIFEYDREDIETILPNVYETLKLVFDVASLEMDKSALTDDPTVWANFRELRKAGIGSAADLLAQISTIYMYMFYVCKGNINDLEVNTKYLVRRISQGNSLVESPVAFAFLLRLSSLMLESSEESQASANLVRGSITDYARRRPVMFEESMQFVARNCFGDTTLSATVTEMMTTPVDDPAKASSHVFGTPVGYRKYLSRDNEQLAFWCEYATRQGFEVEWVMTLAACHYQNGFRLQNGHALPHHMQKMTEPSRELFKLAMKCLRDGGCLYLDQSKTPRYTPGDVGCPDDVSRQLWYLEPKLKRKKRPTRSAGEPQSSPVSTRDARRTIPPVDRVPDSTEDPPQPADSPVDNLRRWWDENDKPESSSITERIRAALASFNRTLPAVPLPMRFGLSSANSQWLRELGVGELSVNQRLSDEIDIECRPFLSHDSCLVAVVGLDGSVDAVPEDDANLLMAGAQIDSSLAIRACVADALEQIALRVGAAAASLSEQEEKFQHWISVQSTTQASRKGTVEYRAGRSQLLSLGGGSEWTLVEGKGIVVDDDVITIDLKLGFTGNRSCTVRAMLADIDGRVALSSIVVGDSEQGLFTSINTQEGTSVYEVVAAIIVQIISSANITWHAPRTTVVPQGMREVAETSATEPQGDEKPTQDIFFNAVPPDVGSDGEAAHDDRLVEITAEGPGLMTRLEMPEVVMSDGDYLEKHELVFNPIHAALRINAGKPLGSKLHAGNFIDLVHNPQAVEIIFRIKKIKVVLRNDISGYWHVIDPPQEPVELTMPEIKSMTAFIGSLVETESDRHHKVIGEAQQKITGLNEAGVRVYDRMQGEPAESKLLRKFGIESVIFMPRDKKLVLQVQNSGIASDRFAYRVELGVDGQFRVDERTVVGKPDSSCWQYLAIRAEVWDLFRKSMYKSAVCTARKHLELLARDPEAKAEVDRLLAEPHWQDLTGTSLSNYSDAEVWMRQLRDLKVIELLVGKPSEGGGSSYDDELPVQSFRDVPDSIRDDWLRFLAAHHIVKRLHRYEIDERTGHADVKEFDRQVQVSARNKRNRTRRFKGQKIGEGGQRRAMPSQRSYELAEIVNEANEKYGQTGLPEYPVIPDFDALDPRVQIVALPDRAVVADFFIKQLEHHKGKLTELEVLAHIGKWVYPFLFGDFTDVVDIDSLCQEIREVEISPNRIVERPTAYGRLVELYGEREARRLHRTWLVPHLDLASKSN